MVPSASVIEGPETEPVTLAQAKLHCRVEVDEDNAYIGALITTARKYIEARLQRQLVTATWRLVLDAFPEWVVELPVAPVQEIESVKYYDLDGVQRTLDEDVYLLAIGSRPARLTPVEGEVWPDTQDRIEAVEVDFVAGYGAVPEDIKQAILWLVAHWYRNREAVDEAALKPVPLGVESMVLTNRWR